MADIVKRLRTNAAERREQFGDSKDLDLLSEAADEIERLRRIDAAARNLIDNSPTGDDDKPYCSDVAQPEFAALAETLN
ncbi:MAG TPA: hypothetical protein VF443_10250 [Nitrospira sp.]